MPPRSGTYRLGIFGSMMDPPHLGHLAVIDAAWRACGLHRVMVVPAGLPPHRSAPSTPARTRLDLAIRAFADLDHVVVSDTEVDRGEHGEVGYMVETIEEALDLPDELGYPDLVVAPTLIVGGDQLATFDRWHRWQDIVQVARIAVALRPDATPTSAVEAAIAKLSTNGAQIDVVPMMPIAISSTGVRDAARRGDRSELEASVAPAIVDDVLTQYGAHRT